MDEQITYGTLGSEGLRALADALDHIKKLPDETEADGAHATPAAGTLCIEGADIESAVIAYRVDDDGKPRVCLFSQDDGPDGDW